MATAQASERMPEGQRDAHGHGAEPLVIDVETEAFLQEMRVSHHGYRAGADCCQRYFNAAPA